MRGFAVALVLGLLLAGCSKSDSSSGLEPEDTVGVLEENPLFIEQWAINPDETFYASHAINQNAHINPQEILRNYSSDGIRIAIIDDGFDFVHPDLASNVVASFYVESTQTTTNASHTLASDYHGTAVAGIVGAKNNTLGIAGVANKAELILIKIPMEGYSDLIGIRAFALAKEYGADVISCSWGTGDVSDTVRAKIIDVATNGRGGKGTLIVFAAGNADAQIGNDESSIEEVIAVGATDHTALRAAYSSYGETLDIMAPGGNELGIATLDPQGSNGASIDGYNRFDERRDGNEVSFIGTSAAAPIVAGALALALEANPTLTREELFANLKRAVTYPSENVPYLYDCISLQSDMATIEGTFGSSAFSEFGVRFISHEGGLSYGIFSIASTGENTWHATATESLPQGEYTVEVVSPDGTAVYATDSYCRIGSSLATRIDYDIKRNDYYGHGKIDLAKLIELSTED